MVTDADNFISGEGAVVEDVEAWRRDFLEELHGPAEIDQALGRYCADLMAAGPRTLRAWEGSVVNETGVTRDSEHFVQVSLTGKLTSRFYCVKNHEIVSCYSRLIDKRSY